MAEPIFERPQLRFLQGKTASEHDRRALGTWMKSPFMHYVYTDMVTSGNHAPVRNLQQANYAVFSL